MIEVRLSDSIKIGGFDYTIDCSKSARDELIGTNCYGDCSNYILRIRIDNEHKPQQFSETTLHEFVEAVNDKWCNNHIEHDDITNLSHGLHQIFEQLGVRFVK